MLDDAVVTAVIRELRLSTWVWAFFTVGAGIITAGEVYMTHRIQGGWPIVALVGGMAWVFALYLAHILRKASR